MELWNWIYVSRSCISSSDIEGAINTIVERSNTNNHALDVTGVLIFDGTHFAQFVEGPRGNIQALRSAIEGDHRHQDVTTILFEAGESRKVANWALAYSGKSVVVTRAIRRAMRDIEQGQPGAGTRLLSHLITLAQYAGSP